MSSGDGHIPETLTDEVETLKNVMLSEEPDMIVAKFSRILSEALNKDEKVLPPTCLETHPSAGLSCLELALEKLLIDSIERCLKPKAFYRHLLSLEIGVNLCKALAEEWAIFGQKLIRNASRAYIGSRLSIGPYMLGRTESCFGLSMNFVRGDNEGTIFQPFMRVTLYFHRTAEEQLPQSETRMLMEFNKEELIRLYNVLEDIQAHLDELRH